ncbi:hypothetical protein RMAECT_0198 [Rickettsia rhipicephali str. Ect]|uniref:Uncharacterized protein n=2 Tax=spotted fever group TaxID=114277 RepID=A0A0F3PGU5_RICRH|nr:hypothetical protein RMB_02515 [Rickettsia massiliae str. AZT80]KJV78464.1 hypothetical protein RMAECT_0198 [Rickettsia rhipicephali str. Ect]
MAKTFVAEGDALVLCNQNEEAVETYATAKIYIGITIKKI